MTIDEAVTYLETLTDNIVDGDASQDLIKALAVIAAKVKELSNG